MIEVIFVGVVFVVSQIVRDIVCGGKKFGVDTIITRTGSPSFTFYGTKPESSVGPASPLRIVLVLRICYGLPYVFTVHKKVFR
jgi:hypothetical protein